MAVAALAMAGMLAGCATVPSAPAITFPPATFGPGAITSATDTTRRTIERALAGIGLTAAAAQSPYRPGEAARFTTAPRVVIEVTLPGTDAILPIVIYEFSNEDAAMSAGDEQARYVASPVGQVLFPPNTQFIMRRDVRTVVFYAWLPAEGEARAGEIAKALTAVGVEIEVPR